jgi:hypothetical protein
MAGACGELNAKRLPDGTVIKTGHAAPPSGIYVERMHHSDFRNQVRECPNCGRLVRLNREGRYRRHFATEPDGRLRLCPASGHTSAGVVARDLRRLDL